MYILMAVSNLIKVSKKTKMSQQQIMEKATQYFQKDNSLKLTSSDPCCVMFGEMYLNYVKVSVSKEDDGFEVTVESKEYEGLAKSFLEKLK
jgi:hypothetical protein